jgi:hypothetical protein
MNIQIIDFGLERLSFVVTSDMVFIYRKAYTVGWYNIARFIKYDFPLDHITFSDEYKEQHRKRMSILNGVATKARENKI